ncbi:MAG: hypothetical protein SWE60_19400 [Thermodesulfobacteriota bacterium]|nr:hypothetical protein [Thermodesulfobacteriota bacterium]
MIFSTTMERKVLATTMATTMNIITMTEKTPRGWYLLCLEKNRKGTRSRGMSRWVHPGGQYHV